MILTMKTYRTQTLVLFFTLYFTILSFHLFYLININKTIDKSTFYNSMMKVAIIHIPLFLLNVYIIPYYKKKKTVDLNR